MADNVPDGPTVGELVGAGVAALFAGIALLLKRLLTRPDTTPSLQAKDADGIALLRADVTESMRRHVAGIEAMIRDLDARLDAYDARMDSHERDVVDRVGKVREQLAELIGRFNERSRR